MTLKLLFAILMTQSAFARSVKIEFILPDYTLNDNVYVTGNTGKLCNWKVKCINLKRENKNLYTATLDIPATGAYIKVTRGSWDSEGVDKKGAAYKNFFIPYFSFTRGPIKIKHWKDQLGKYHQNLVDYERRDRKIKSFDNLVVGSSSARMWTTIEKDFAPIEVHSRGAGGANISDLVTYKKRMIYKYKPKYLYLYIGENDLAWVESPAKVYADLVALIKDINKNLPNTKVHCLSIKASPSRNQYLEKIKKYNHLMSGSELCQYIDTYSAMFDASGKLRSDIWKSDKLHMNQKGYQIWAKEIKAYLY